MRYRINRKNKSMKKSTWKDVFKAFFLDMIIGHFLGDDNGVDLNPDVNGTNMCGLDDWGERKLGLLWSIPVLLITLLFLMLAFNYSVYWYIAVAFGVIVFLILFIRGVTARR